MSKSKNLVDLSHLPCPEGHHLEIRTVRPGDKILLSDGTTVRATCSSSNSLRVIVVPDEPPGKWVDVEIGQWWLCGKKARFRDRQDDTWTDDKDDSLCGFRGTHFLCRSMSWKYAQVWIEDESFESAS